MPVATTALVAVCRVSGIDVIVTLQFALINISSIRTRLVIKARIPSDVVGSRPVVVLLVATGVLRDQVGHAACIAVDLHFTVEPVVVGVGVQGAVRRSSRAGEAEVHAGHAGVGRAVVQHLSAVAAAGGRQREDRLVCTVRMEKL